MSGRGILVFAAAALCWMAAPGHGFASADNVSSGFDSGDALERGVTAAPNATVSPDLQAAVDAGLIDQSLGANPLWGIPLAVLNATRDRPLFSPSRRPAAAAAMSAPVRAVKSVSSSPAPAPTLDLIGIVEGNSEGYAVFIDTTTHSIVRLKTGEGQDGWILRSVREREAVIYNNDRTEVLELPSIAGQPKR